MTTQPHLFAPGPPQPVSTEALMRRLAELEQVRDGADRLRVEQWPWITPSENYLWLMTEIDRIKAELWARGHAVGGPRRD